MIDEPGPWGSGPYELVEGFSGLEERAPRVVLRANARYWNPNRMPKLAEIVFDNSLRQEEALKLIASTEGKVDLVTHVQPKQAALLAGSQYARLVSVDINSPVLGLFNRAKAVWQDARVRRAANLAVDRAAVISQGLEGYGKMLPALIPSWSYGHDGQLDTYPYRPEEARRLLTEATYPKEQSLKLVSPALFGACAQVVADNLQDLGLRVQVQVLDPEPDNAYNPYAFMELMKTAEWDILLHAHFDWSPGNPIPVLHREYFGQDGLFRTGPPDGTFDRLYAELVATTKDEAAHLQKAREIEGYAYHQALALFLCTRMAHFAVNRHVNFVPCRSTVLDLAETSVSPQHASLAVPAG